MSIPEECTVLVVGGGPGGSYAAAVLAREGISTVLLEADVFPRYHIGESMLASMRHFFRFIDLDMTFDNYGFTKKCGAAFKLNDKGVGYTDFVAAGGPDSYAWNLVRSESDDLMFRHAGKSDAKIFDGVKVDKIDFVPWDGKNVAMDSGVADPGRPVSATWSRKDGSSGVITFEYLVDASGRAGLMTTKYLKNRKYNQGLKNVASWGYWKEAGQYAVGTSMMNQPFFQALQDSSGWAWAIPLHNSTMSVGVVMDQAMSISKKKAMGSPSGHEFYLQSLKLAPTIMQLLSKAQLVTDVKSASDWSYTASTYASPFVRIVGDAGCFIDPFFSSGVHLALASALSAAVTICAARRGDCNEEAAGKWHSCRVADGYSRFLLVVLSALKQIKQRDEHILSDWDEDGFDRAFAFFRPIIQGTADVGGKLTQAELSKTIDFCLNAFQPTAPNERDAVLRKINGTSGKAEVSQEPLSAEELRVLNTIRARQMVDLDSIINIDSFSADTIDGMAPSLKCGSLGLVKAMSGGMVHAPPLVNVAFS